jgi:hypothetical protein
MANNSEKGHAKNVANFSWLREEVEGFGIAYNPGPADIRLNNLLTVESDLKVAMEGLANALADHKDAINARQFAFEDLDKRCTRIIGEAIASGADKKILADLRHLVRKIRGKRAKPIKEEEIPPPATPFVEGKAPESDPAPKVRKSASQASYDYQKEHFVQMVSLIGKIPGYAPNEADMSMSGLEARALLLGNSTKLVYHTISEVEKAREIRDRLLYKSFVGAVELAVRVKNHVKSAFGHASNQFKAVAQIDFKAQKYGGL